VTDTTNMTETELADYYDRTSDLSEFEDGEVVQIEPGPKSSVVSVRFAPGELEAVERQANKVGMKLTAFIRASALSGAHVVDLDRLRKVVATLVADSEEMGKVVDLPTGRRSRPTASPSSRSSAERRSGRTAAFQKSSKSTAANALGQTAARKVPIKAASKSTSSAAARKSTMRPAKSPPKGKASHR
jgi:predicted DNA binding CopG/RHH family protein